MLAQRPVGGQAAFRRDASFDTDRDGMPDVWEIRHGLNPVAANNNADFDADGYTDLEEYLNDISAWPAPAPIEFAAAGGRYAEIGNWVVDTPTVTAAGAQNAFEDFHWQPSRFDTAVIHSGSVVVDAVGQHAGNLVLGMNPGDAVSFAITAGWLEVEDAPDGLSDGITVIDGNPAAVASLALSGGWLTTKTLLKGPGGSFAFTGGGLTAETVGFDLVNQGGLIAPSRGTGAMRVMGDLTLESGSLLLEIRGTQNSQHDRVVVDGALAAGGMLDVVLNGYTAVAGDVFDLVAIQGSGALNTGGYRPGPPAVPVPEPASGLVVAMVASLGCWSGSRRRRG